MSENKFIFYLGFSFCPPKIKPQISNLVVNFQLMAFMYTDRLPKDKSMLSDRTYSILIQTRTRNWLGGRIRGGESRDGGMTEDSVPGSENHLHEGPPHSLIHRFLFYCCKIHIT